MTDYDRHGHGYALKRREDPRIAAAVHGALGDARTVLNVGAGAGSYEPVDRYVLAVEPSATMRAQRGEGRVPAVDARAEQLPFDEDSVDAAMAISTIHHWREQERGLRELRRVARGRVVVLTFDPAALRSYWLIAEYGPEIGEVERELFPPIEEVAGMLGAGRVTPIAVGADCADGIVEAYFSRPEAYLDPAVRAAQSAWWRLPDGVEERIVDALDSDLASGAWDARHPGLRAQRLHESSLRLIVWE